MGFNERIFLVEDKQYRVKSTWTNYNDCILRLYNEKNELQFELKGRVAFNIDSVLLDQFSFNYSIGEDQDARSPEDEENKYKWCQHFCDDTNSCYKCGTVF